MLKQHYNVPLFGLMAQAAQKMDDPTPANVADARQHLQDRAKLPKALNAAAIAAFYEGDQAAKDAAKVAGAEKSRLNWLIHLMFKEEGDKLTPIVDAGTVKNEAAAYVKMKAAEVGYKGGKGAGKRPPAVKVAGSRAAEVKALYGAIRFTGYDYKGKGYHDAIAGARDALLSKGLKPDGTKIPDDEQRKLDKLVRQEVGKVGAVDKAVAAKVKELGRPLTDDERQAIYAESESIAKAQQVADICDDILKRFGVAVAEQVVAIMPQQITAFEAQLQQKQTEEK